MALGRSRAWVWFALGAVVIAGIALRIVHLDDIPSRGPDETFYLHFASRVANNGIGEMRTLFAEYEADSEKWSYPVPNRVSYVLLTAMSMSLTSRRDERPGVAISCLFSILSLLLVAWMGLRFFNGWVATSATAFMAFSVSELGMAPRAWADAMFAFLGLLLLYTMCEITRNPRRKRWYSAFCGAGVLLLLTKQTGVVGYGACGLWVMWMVAWKERYRKGAVLLVVGGLASIALTIATWSMLAGGASVALSALDHSLHPSAAGRQYVAENSSGPWYRFIYLMWVVGPLTAVLALGGGLVVVLRRAFLTVAEARAAASALVMTLGFVGFSSFVPGMQNLRYICPANGAYCLLAGLGLWYPMAMAQRSWPASRYRKLLILTITTVVLVLTLDYHTFTVLLSCGLLDFTVKDILDCIGQG